MMEKGGSEGVWKATESCQKFDLALQTYLEGESQPELVAHAAECAFCGALVADLELIRSAAPDLALDEPPARVWKNVRATLLEEGLIRFEPRGRDSHWAWLAWMRNPVPVAALAVLLAFGTFAVKSEFNRNSVWSSTPQVTSVAVDPGVEQAVQQMEVAFQERATTLDPSVKSAYQHGLESLDSEIRECRGSLEREPNDSLTREYLTAAYTEKAQVLASALDMDNRGDF